MAKFAKIFDMPDGNQLLHYYNAGATNDDGDDVIVVWTITDIDEVTIDIKASFHPEDEHKVLEGFEAFDQETAESVYNHIIKVVS